MASGASEGLELDLKIDALEDWEEERSFSGHRGKLKWKRE